MARGTLRIYLGAAPGVGKTFAMLGEGRRRADRGTDVVVGYVETHGRKKTIDQIADLEVVPRTPVEYRGTTFEEMDLDAILARRPEVALVDELAHTNVPGSRHEKRWEDVEALLEAGITVISTLNIQHLESVNDVVEQVTGVKQQETIPDAVVRRADQIDLVDMAPEAIRRRMAHGNIYPAERIDAALGNYFRAGNLGALRELALLWVADRVDDALQEYRERHGIQRPWETRERVVVALTGSADGERLVRRAARMAERSKGDLFAVHVRPQDGLAAGAAAMLDQQRELVTELGGTYREVAGEDIGEALVSAAHTLNATQLILGASRRSRFAELTRGSVINRVIRDSGSRPRRSRDQPRRRWSRCDDRQTCPPARLPPTAARPPRVSARRRRAAAADVGAHEPALRPRPAEHPAALPVARRRDRRRRWSLAGARGSRSGLPPRQLVLHATDSHVHDLRRRKSARAVGLRRRGCGHERFRLIGRQACRSRNSSSGRGRGARRARGCGARPDPPRWAPPDPRARSRCRLSSKQMGSGASTTSPAPPFRRSPPTPRSSSTTSTYS